MRVEWFVILGLLLSAVGFSASAQDSSAPCGVVDAIDYPINNLVAGYDDFSLYRPRFGGNHTGIDIGFDRWGEPVRAAARGRVTYSDVEGWDTEKGVVVIEHTMPDSSRVYSVYGHMEQTDGIGFPALGACVERGGIIGAIGWPSRGRPHLHYEIRDFLPDDGGPGYVTGNPLAEGWYNPLDFTALWRARLTPAYVGSMTFDMVASVPPVITESGQYVVASGSLIAGVLADRQVLWRVETDGPVNGLAVLPGERVIAHSRQGQVVALQNGRYLAVWSVASSDEPFVTLGETLVFALPDGGLQAYDPTGALLWALPGLEGARLIRLDHSSAQVAVGVRAADGVVWRVVDAAGQIIADWPFDASPAAAALTDDLWIALNGAQVEQIRGAEREVLATISPPPGRSAALTVDLLGNSYIYLGDADSTLVSVGEDGGLRWRMSYPFAANYLPPLLQTGAGCLLYTLDADGRLNVFSTTDGTLVNQVQLYAGGTERSSPRARLLRIDAQERVLVASGFLTMITFDGRVLGGAQAANCILG